MDCMLKCPVSRNKRKPHKDSPFTTYLVSYNGHRPCDYHTGPSAKPPARSTCPWLVNPQEEYLTTYTFEFQRRKIDPLVPVHFDFLKQLRKFQKHFPMETRTENMTYGTKPTREVFIDSRLEELKREYEIAAIPQVIPLPKYPPRPYDYSKICERPTHKYYLVPRTLAECTYD